MAKTKKKKKLDQSVSYRENDIQIKGTEANPKVLINDHEMELEFVDEDHTLCRVEGDFNVHNSPREAAEGFIDMQLALMKPQAGMIKMTAKKK